MSAPGTPAAAAEAFDRSRVRFDGLVGLLAGQEAGGLAHFDLEARLEAEGRELLRQLFQDHLDLRADRERPAVSVVGADASVDCIVCTEVLPDCPEPRAVMSEFRRVLRPSGRVFLTTGFLVGLSEVPNDYYRFTPCGLRHPRRK